MENQGNSSILELTVKAGETIILKGEDGATISEVKKPKRNTAKEREWEQSKYHRFTFLVDKPQAEQFIELLSGKRPLDWFREEITSYIENTLNGSKYTLNADKNNTLNGVSDTLNDNKNTFNVNNVKCAKCGTLNDGYTNGYFRCSNSNCEFINYETKEKEEEDEEENTLNEDCENTFNLM